MRPVLSCMNVSTLGWASRDPTCQLGRAGGIFGVTERPSNALKIVTTVNRPVSVSQTDYECEGLMAGVKL